MSPDELQSINDEYKERLSLMLDKYGTLLAQQSLPAGTLEQKEERAKAIRPLLASLIAEYTGDMMELVERKNAHPF